MTPATQCEIASIASKLDIVYEVLSEDTVRLKHRYPTSPKTIQNIQSPPNLSFPVFLICRENVPPLKNTYSKLLVLKEHRCSIIENSKELIDVLNEIQNNATSVDNDTYLFSSDGTHIFYVSHHDEILIWERSAQQGA